MTGTRRGNRESTFSTKPNKNGRYEAKVWMGTRPDGRPDRRHVERKTLAAVRKRVRELERQRDAGVVPGAGKIPTVQQMLERHIGVVLVQRGRAPRTILDYQSKCRNDIYPALGGQRIDRLLPEHIEDFYAKLLKDGHAAAHVVKVHAILSSALGEQVRRGQLTRNPCALVQPPRILQREVTALTLEQARTVLEAAQKRRNPARWAVGLAVGLRQGEALGLRWSYVDLDAGEARIWHQLQILPWQHGCADPAKCGKRGADCPARHSGGLVFRPTKENRRKTARLSAVLVNLLKAHREAQGAEREAAMDLWEDYDLVFCQPNGRPIGPRADWGEWKAILEAAGIAHVGVHAMRHSAATLALAEGIPLPVVQELLGHSDIRVTRGYTHVPSALAADAADRMGAALLGP